MTLIPFRILVAAGLLFGTGVLTGVGVVRLSPMLNNRSAVPSVSASDKVDSNRSTVVEPIDRPVRTNTARLGGLRPPGVSRLEQLRRLLGELELSVDQRARVELHLQTTLEHLKKLLKPLQPEASRELRELRLRLAAELTADQRLQFDRLLAERSERANNRLKSPIR